MKAMTQLSLESYGLLMMLFHIYNVHGTVHQSQLEIFRLEMPGCLILFT